jgi:hypothetical protein
MNETKIEEVLFTTKILKEKTNEKEKEREYKLRGAVFLLLHASFVPLCVSSLPHVSFLPLCVFFLLQVSFPLFLQVSFLLLSLIPLVAFFLPTHYFIIKEMFI